MHVFLNNNHLHLATRIVLNILYLLYEIRPVWSLTGYWRCILTNRICNRQPKSWLWYSGSINLQTRWFDVYLVRWELITHAVACRGLVMPGATAWLDALPNYSIEQWRMVVIVTGYTLFVTSPYDVIFTFLSQLLAKYVDTTCILYYTHSPYSLLYNVSL